MENILSKFDPIAAPVGRLLLALIFIAAGFNKMTSDPAGTIAYMNSMGIPGYLFWPTALFEVLGGLAVLVGFKTRIVAFLLAGFCLVTAGLAHADFSDQIQMTLFLKNLSMAGGFLILMRFGAGEMSIDNRATAND